MLDRNRFLKNYAGGFSVLVFVLFGLNLYQTRGRVDFNPPFLAALLSLICVYALNGALYAYICHKLKGNEDKRRERRWNDLFFVVVQHLGLLNIAFFMHYFLLVYHSATLPLRIEVFIYGMVWLAVLVPICLYRIFKRVPDAEQKTGNDK